MKTEHTVSIERCKKLTELGFPECSQCYARVWDEEDILRIYSGAINAIEQYVCPSVMELLDELPKLNGEHWISIEKCTSDYHVCMRINSGAESVAFNSSHLPNALADLWIWCVDNGYITPKK